MLYILSAGIGIVVLGLLLLLWSLLTMRKFDFTGYQQSKINKYMDRLWKDLKLKTKSNLDKKGRAMIVGIALLVAGAGNSVISTFKLFIYGLLAGTILLMLIMKYRQDVIKVKKLKETVILFEAVELYIKSGYSLYQSLKVAKVMTSLIKPALDKCLNSWNRGTQKALEILQKELNMAESETLILLLLHMETAGRDNLDGMLKREAVNIEHLQNIKTKIKIANRPLIMMVYRMLPLFSVLGIIAGGLLYRTYSVLRDAGILNF